MTDKDEDRVKRALIEARDVLRKFRRDDSVQTVFVSRTVGKTLMMELRGQAHGALEAVEEALKQTWGVT